MKEKLKQSSGLVHLSGHKLMHPQVIKENLLEQLEDILSSTGSSTDSYKTTYPENEHNRK